MVAVMRFAVEQEIDRVMNDAISFFVPKSVAQLAQETGLQKRHVKQWLDAREGNTIERRGNKYRIDCANDWPKG